MKAIFKIDYSRYCAKLPSDTFTRLTPEWSVQLLDGQSPMTYTCSLRLPINSPVKYVISVCNISFYINHR